MWLQRVEAVAAQAAARGHGWYLLADPTGARLGSGALLRPADCGSVTEFLRLLAAGNWVFALSYELGCAHSGILPGATAAAANPSFAIRREHEEILPPPPALPAAVPQHENAGSASAAAPAAASPSPVTHKWRRSDDRYLADVRACQAAIKEGESYVLCLTDTAETSCTLPAKAAAQLPLTVYKQLTADGPALRGGVLVAGDQALVSASPEQFLSVRAGSVTTHPIKGTRPRGATPAADAAFAAELASDPKERAENLMIVDLLRNDLSRVCLPGSVRVPELYRVESHPRVHQLVSTVRGQLRRDVGLLELLASAFPGGSMTGAPKRSSCEILARLEGAPRGLYSGCFGWIAAAADAADGGAGEPAVAADTADAAYAADAGTAAPEWEAELAMTIRAVHITGLPHPATVAAAPQEPCLLRATVGAGGGITSDSVPAAELAERNLKAAAPVTAVLAASAN